MKDYTAYTAQDFALDKYFQQWVIAPDEEVRHFWESWLVEHPEKQAEIIEARAFIQTIPFEHYVLSPEEDRGIWMNISSRLSVSESDSLPSRKVIRRTWFSFHWYQYAAVLLLPLLAGLIYFTTFSSYETYSTGYGEKQVIPLPDGSVVTLNANSTLEYRNNWEQQVVRQVWLTGEAFFDVQEVIQQQDGQPATKVKFVVHTPQVEVEVLGTEFNVKHRRYNTEVVLNSGKILLKREQKAITMLPGERVEVSDTSTLLLKELVNVEAYDAWKSNRFVFDNSSLEEVAQMLRDTYGYEVEIAPGIQSRKISSTAPVPTKNMLAFLEMLENLYRVTIVKKQNVILIKKYESTQ